MNDIALENHSFIGITFYSETLFLYGTGNISKEHNHIWSCRILLLMLAQYSLQHKIFNTLGDSSEQF